MSYNVVQCRTNLEKSQMSGQTFVHVNEFGPERNYSNILCGHWVMLFHVCRVGVTCVFLFVLGLVAVKTSVVCQMSFIVGHKLSLGAVMRCEEINSQIHITS